VVGVEGQSEKEESEAPRQKLPAACTSRVGKAFPLRRPRIFQAAWPSVQAGARRGGEAVLKRGRIGSTTGEDGLRRA
jgi:hypothetical protein